MQLARKLLVLLTLVWCGLSQAADFSPVKAALAPLTGNPAEILLVAEGRTTRISQADIERLPLYQTTLTTHWGTRGTFQGVLLKDLLKSHKLVGHPLTLVALDGYRATLSVSDYESSPAILATRLNGRPITYADKGPFILLWPKKEQLALQGKMRLSDWIWGLNELRVKLQ